ncbi:hypothetical protein Poli38472_008867 [Pythium oligandrum]|uniref:Uncharacterized protein n=1 Tax=Pythium oligandrum TaxID=41045 RepID=A0A8K1FCU9_PYTOL|nr:hypothetical protein Poli38472_008867 [Pythium oligandrum]|eukprot:TMW56219.1 hypothetical protein Poli38472_008867 [Pythium oligandrum]
MASDMTSAFRDFALKKLNEAKQKGATLATVTAATAASISSSVQVPGPTAFVFRGNGNREQLTTSELSVDKKIAMLKDANGALKQAARQHPSETLEASLYKMELINESLAFTIGNVQECSHMMKMMHRQFRDLGSMQQSDDRFFYRKDRGRNAMHASSTTTTTVDS